MLVAWGQLIDAFTEDASFRELTRTVVECATCELEDSGEVAEIEEFIKMIPSLIVALVFPHLWPLEN